MQIYANKRVICRNKRTLKNKIKFLKIWKYFSSFFNLKKKKKDARCRPEKLSLSIDEQPTGAWCSTSGFTFFFFFSLCRSQPSNFFFFGLFCWLPGTRNIFTCLRHTRCTGAQLAAAGEPVARRTSFRSKLLEISQTFGFSFFFVIYILWCSKWIFVSVSEENLNIDSISCGIWTFLQIFLNFFKIFKIFFEKSTKSCTMFQVINNNLVEFFKKKISDRTK